MGCANIQPSVVRLAIGIIAVCDGDYTALRGEVRETQNTCDKLVVCEDYDDDTSG